MDDTQLVESIKIRLGITGTYHDAMILAYANDVRAFMLSGGVARIIIDSKKSVGVIARGVADLWNYGAGDGKFSEQFFQRMSQLTFMTDSVEDIIVPIDEQDIDECTECLYD